MEAALFIAAAILIGGFALFKFLMHIIRGPRR